MRYWFDSEFIEDGPLRPVDLVSIGILADDGRAYYAQRRECKLENANAWFMANVYPSIQHKNCYDHPACFPASDCPWKTGAEIAADLKTFCDPTAFEKPEFWAYFGDYDWVVLAQLFGRMSELPEGWPMYARDIKQWCDDLGNPQLPEQGKGEHNALADARWNRVAWEFLRGIHENRGLWALYQSPQTTFSHKATVPELLLGIYDSEEAAESAREFFGKKQTLAVTRYRVNAYLGNLELSDDEEKALGEAIR